MSGRRLSKEEYPRWIPQVYSPGIRLFLHSDLHISPELPLRHLHMILIIKNRQFQKLHLHMKNLLQQHLQRPCPQHPLLLHISLQHL